MRHRRQPDPLARALSHVIVGALVGAMTSNMKGIGFVAGAVLGAAVHEALDAPAADVLTDIGI